ncbi:unnamed protein product [Larinioides sclopetarius]|uniref:Cytochrome c oxidase subunit II n=1 Tax=Larinioides sclopetarius TaxID=280406 RepID=A0AAV1ZSD1_9ARAC
MLEIYFTSYNTLFSIDITMFTILPILEIMTWFLSHGSILPLHLPGE